VSNRRAKKMAKNCVKELGLTLLAVARRVLLVAPAPGFLCCRWHAYSIVAMDHPRLAEFVHEKSVR
jgi:hypothetical protein